MFCPNCGMENADQAAECRRCHVPLQEETHAEAPAGPGDANAAGTLCSRCETFNEPGVERCTTCGYPLGAPGATPDAGTPAPHLEPEAPHALHASDELGGEPPAAAELHHEDDAGSTHALEPLLTHDTPAEGSPSIAEELSALELSPEDARAARGDDATPPDGSPPVALHPVTEEHQLAPSLLEDDEEPTSVAPEPEFPALPARAAAPAPVRAPSSPGLSARRVSSAPDPLPPVATPPPPIPTPAPALAAAAKHCASCGSANLPNAKFCAECGTPFPKKAAAPAVSAPPPTPAPPVLAAHDEPEANVAAAREVPRHEELVHEEPAREELHHEALAHEELHYEAPVHEELHHEELAGTLARDEETTPGALEPHGEPPLEEHAEAAEELHGELHEEAAQPEEHGQFDAQKTDPSQKAASEEADRTSEQPRIVIADEALQEAEPEHPAELEAAEAPLEHEAPLEAEPGGSVQLAEEYPAGDTPAEPAHAFEAAPEAAPEEVPEEAREEAPAEALEAAESPEPLEEPAPEAAEEAQAPAAEAPPYGVLLVVEKGEHAGTTFQLAAMETSIGGVGAAVELSEDVHLAAHHATVFFEEQRLLLRDEGAANGVYLKLREPAALEAGDQFIAGQRLLRFDGPVELGSAEDPLPFQGAPRPAGAPVRVVELLSGGRQGRTCHRAGPVIAVGKSGCDLNFGSDEVLAPRHAEIHLAEDGSASLVDLGAVADGVLLRVRPGQTVELQAGDVLQLGGQTLRIELE